MNPEQHLLLDDALRYTRASLALLQGNTEGRIEATTSMLIRIERGFRDAADLIRQVRARSEQDDDEIEIGEEP